jgi:hypothetical protein
MSPRRRGPAWQGAAALAVLVAGMAWSLAATLHSDRAMPPTSPYLVAPIALTIGVVGGIMLASWASSPWLSGCLLAAAVILAVEVPLSDEPGTQPLGYPNANAALAVQLLGLCGLALVSLRPGRRWPMVAAAGLALVVMQLNRSAGALFVGVPLAVTIGVVLWRPPRRRWWIVPLGSATMLIGACAVLWLAAADTWPRVATRAFDPVRRQLWHDAGALWRAHPVAGGGVGSFVEFSPRAADPDTVSAHSSVLQIGAETGSVGVALFAAVCLAGLLWATRGRTALAVVGAAAWTALIMQSLIDHVLEFVPVVVAAGLVLGWAAVGPVSEELDVPEAEDPVPG